MAKPLSDVVLISARIPAQKVDPAIIKIFDLVSNYFIDLFIVNTFKKIKSLS